MLPQTAIAQMSSSAQVRLELLTPASLINTRDMDFARIVPPAAIQTVTVNGSDQCTPTGGMVVSGNCSAAHFSGWGTPNAQVRIRIDQNSIQLTGPGTPMLLNNFAIYGNPDLAQIGNGNNGNGFRRYRIQTSSGVFDFRVGGRLRVNANQAPGQYSGQFSVTLNYQ